MNENTKVIGSPKPIKHLFKEVPSEYELTREDARRFALMYVDPEKIVFLSKYDDRVLKFHTSPRHALLCDREYALGLAYRIYRKYDLDMKVVDINDYI